MRRIPKALRAARPFPPNTLVRLRWCPHGEPGVVVGESRGLVLVDWRDLGILGKHPPGNLTVLAPASQPWDCL